MRPSPTIGTNSTDGTAKIAFIACEHKRTSTALTEWDAADSTHLLQYRERDVDATPNDVEDDHQDQSEERETDARPEIRAASLCCGV